MLTDNFLFEVQLNNVIFICGGGHLEPPLYSARIENVETLYQSIFMPVKPFATGLGPLKGGDSPWSAVPMRALNHVKDILNICCESWLHKQYKLKVIKLRTRVLNVSCQVYMYSFISHNNKIIVNVFWLQVSAQRSSDHEAATQEQKRHNTQVSDVSKMLHM